LASYSKEDYALLSTLKDISLHTFEANYEKIEGMIIAINMGKESNIPLKNQLVMLKNRLVKEISVGKSKDIDISMSIRQYLKEGDLGKAMEIAKQFTDEYFGDNITSQL
jgi:hypothetical protein